MSLTNVWHLRKVAETSSKACYICYKPTTSVLVTPDKKVLSNAWGSFLHEGLTTV